MEMNQKGNDNFNTPDNIFNQLNEVYNFTIDAACDSSNLKCELGWAFDKGMDGLKMEWSGHRVFCNPPFSQKDKWIKKAIQEVENNNCPICVMVLPLNCMSASFFYDGVICGRYEYEILKGRISFLDNETKKPKSGNNSGTVIVYFRKKIIV